MLNRWESGNFRVRRVRHAESLAAFLEEHEPRTTRMLADLAAVALRPWKCRAWAVESESRRLAAVVVVVRSCFDSWYASVFISDPSAAPIVAAIIDRSPAWSVVGSGADIRPIVDHLARLSDIITVPWIISEYPHTIAPDPDDRTRFSRNRDLPQLVDLFARYELNPAATRRQARSWARRLIARSVIIVAEDRGRIVGAVALLMESDRYAVVDRITVLPSHRKRGLSWALGARAQAFSNAMGVSGLATIAPTNPMSFDEADLAEQSWMSASLRPPYRWRGQNRLRSMYSRFGRLDRSPIEVFRDPQTQTARRNGEAE